MKPDLAFQHKANHLVRLVSLSRANSRAFRSSPDAHRVADVLCAVLHSLGDSAGELSRIHAVPGPGVDGAAGSQHDHGAVGMPERLPLSAA